MMCKRSRVIALCAAALVIATALYFVFSPKAQQNLEHEMKKIIHHDAPDLLESSGNEEDSAGTEKNERSAQEKTTSEDPELPGFDLLSNEWWENNVGCDTNKLKDENIFIQNITLNAEMPILANASLLKTSDADHYVFVECTGAVIYNAYIEGSVMVPGENGEGSVLIEYTTFEMDKVRRFAIGGMGITARFNVISSLNDGVNPTDGHSAHNLIEYNWIKGPGYKVGDNHMDGIQFWREGNATIRRNRFSGFDNACILIKSDAAPRSGDEPISDILITENYFEAQGLAWYYLFVCANEANPTEYYLTRPQYITITNNCFESKNIFPIYTGLEENEAAIFVRTEQERDEGLRRQEAYPEVLELRRELGWAKSAVDARTWIVWNGNYYKEDGSEVRPYDGKSDRGWYDLSVERGRFPYSR